MSTRCYIAKRIAPGKYKTIYCHSDGYPEGVGRTLLDYYNCPEKIDKLLELGDISILDKWLKPCPTLPHGFGGQLLKNGTGYISNRQEGVTLAYERDRGESGRGAQIYTLKELDSGGMEYVYVFSNGVWKYFKRLTDGMQFLDEPNTEK